MKKTVGDLVYEQEIKEGYDPAVAERIAPAFKNAFEAHEKVVKAFEPIKEPLRKSIEMANSAFKSVRPQLDILNGISIPTLDREDFVVPRTVQEVRVVNAEDIGRASTRRESQFVIASYLLPQNATWEALDIKFIDGHFVQVSYPNMDSKKFDYKDMGFVNMKTTNPDQKWKLLQAIAENGGALTNSKWSREFGRNIKYELNEGLKRFFGMKTNPIPHYTKKNGYRVLFSLRGER